jgi:hypothetical protein
LWSTFFGFISMTKGILNADQKHNHPLSLHPRSTTPTVVVRTHVAPL